MRKSLVNEKQLITVNILHCSLFTCFTYHNMTCIRGFDEWQCGDLMEWYQFPEHFFWSQIKSLGVFATAHLMQGINKSWINAETWICWLQSCEKTTIAFYHGESKRVLNYHLFTLHQWWWEFTRGKRYNEYRGNGSK